MSSRDDGGFTLVELLVVLALAGVLMTAFVGALGSTLHWGGEVAQRSILQTEARATIDGLVAELRQAYTGDATPLVEQATPTSITFDSPDRQSPMHLRRISYRLVNGQLQRSMTVSSNTGTAPWTFPAATGPWQRRLDSIVNGTVFSYADSTGAATTDPTKVKTVTVTVTIATFAAKARQATYSTAVTLRAAT